MEARTQEITSTRQKGCFKDLRLPGGLVLVCPKVIFVGYPKKHHCHPDPKELCMVLEKSKGFWPMVQAATT